MTKKKTKSKTARTTSPAKKTAKKSMARTAAKKPCAKSTTKKPAKTARPPVKRTSGDELFKGATEISLTENKIAITKSVSRSTNGKYTSTTKREYHDRTPANMRAFESALKKGGMKKITVKMK